MSSVANNSSQIGGVPPAAGTRPRILFVDDEPRILISLKAVFRADYEVYTANGGAEALAILKQTPVDVIVSDQRMPGLTGIDVLRQAREICPRAVRLLLTGYSDLNAIIGSINEGEIFRFVTKPWVNKDLRETVATAMRTALIEVVPARPEGDPASQASAGRTRPEVLLLEEHAEMAASICRALGPDQAVHRASSVDQALELLERHPIGILITELFIDNEPITAMISALRQNHPLLVTIVLTNRADATLCIDLINYGQVYRLLQKPVSDGLLRGAVNIAVRRYETLASRPDQAQRVVAKVPPRAMVEKKRGLFDRIRRLFAG
jgi:serine/threonine-protein kinase